MSVDREGRILVAPAGVGRELKEMRHDKRGKPNLNTKHWELPPAPDGRRRRAFRSSLVPVHYQDTDGTIRTRRFKFVDEGNGVIACRTDLRSILIDTDDLRWRMIHRDGSVVRSRVTHIDGTPVSTIPSAQIVFERPNCVRVLDVAEDTDWRLFITPDFVVETVWLKSDAAPRDWAWSMVTPDTERFRFEDTNELCRDNLDGSATAARKAAGDFFPNRWLEINDFGGPQIDVRRRDGQQRIRIRKRWTGRVSKVPPHTRVARWVDEPAAYPAKIR